MQEHFSLSPSQLESLVEGVATAQYAVLDNFLSAEACANLRCFAEAQREAGNLKAAGIGKQHEHQIARTIRSDFMLWLAQNHPQPEVQSFQVGLLQALAYFNQTCFLGLKDFESQLAIYPEGAFYAKHKDRFLRNAHRVLSVVCYLNEADWSAEDGGQLLLYLPDTKKPAELLPRQGRLVIFRSELEHEVCIAHRTRYSLTAWLLDQVHTLTFLP
jgi:SM-20-related protein